MTVLSNLGLSLAVAVALAGGVIALLWCPLHRLMLDACGSATRARFWCVYLSLAFVLTACVAVAWTGLGFPAARSTEIAIEGAVRWSLATVTAATGVLGWGVWRSLQRLVAAPASAPAAAPAPLAASDAVVL